LLLRRYGINPTGDLVRSLDLWRLRSAADGSALDIAQVFWPKFYDSQNPCEQELGK
jgi:hypothetical protein